MSAAPPPEPEIGGELGGEVGTHDGTGVGSATGSGAGSGLPGPPGVGPRVRYLRPALTVAGVVTILGAIVGLAVDGMDGAVGFAAGVVLVATSYTVSTLAIAWADSINPRMVFPVGMAMYVTKFSLLGAMLIFVGATDWGGKIPMAIGIVAGIVAWTGTQIWWTTTRPNGGSW